MKEEGLKNWHIHTIIGLLWMILANVSDSVFTGLISAFIGAVFLFCAGFLDEK